MTQPWCRYDARRAQIHGQQAPTGVRAGALLPRGATAGALFWATGHAALGYGVAAGIGDVADLLVSETGFAPAAAVFLLMCVRLWRSWKANAATRSEALAAKAAE